MDILRSCYETDVDFGDGVPCRIRWYGVPIGTPMLPYDTPFRSENWSYFREWIPGLGEIYNRPRPWRNCARVRGAPLGRPIGTADQWANGIVPGTPYVPLLGPGTPAGTLATDRAHNARAFDQGES